MNATSPTPTTVTLEPGHRPGLIGRIVEMHAVYYAREHGLGRFFEARVAAGLAEFAGRLDRPNNRIWAAVQADRVVGSVTVDGGDLGNGHAHLRWFVMDDAVRGQGVGRRLLDAAMAFVDAPGVSSTELFTFKGLDTARRLYESSGFMLVDEYPGDQWGAALIEQRFVRRRPAR